MDRDAILTIVMVVAVLAVWWYGLFPFHSTRNSLWRSDSDWHWYPWSSISGAGAYGSTSAVVRS